MAWYKDPAYRKILLLRLGEGVLLITLLVAAWYVYGFTVTIRDMVYQQEQELVEAPEQVLRELAQLNELRNSQERIQRLDDLIVTRAEVGVVVSTLEGLATDAVVALQIPTITEVVDEATAAQQESVSGSFVEAEIKLIAVGAPEKLVQFLHAVEHAPWLLAVPSWTIKSSNTAVPGIVPVAPAGLPSGQAIIPVPDSTGLLEASVLLVLKEP